MSRRITFHETKPEKPAPGDAWYDDFEYGAETVATRHHGKRPIRVQLTEGTSFMIYSRMYNQADGWHGDGWKVSGEPHNLTLSPSVNMPSHWHGMIEHGTLNP